MGLEKEEFFFNGFYLYAREKESRKNGKMVVAAAQSWIQQPLEYQRPDLAIKSLCEIAIKIINEWENLRISSSSNEL